LLKQFEDPRLNEDHIEEGVPLSKPETLAVRRGVQALHHDGEVPFVFIALYLSSYRMFSVPVYQLPESSRLDNLKIHLDLAEVVFPRHF
jgi:hypothetical protein